MPTLWTSRSNSQWPVARRECGIEVNTISPTVVNTELMRAHGTEERRQHWIQPEHVAHAALYLAVDAPPHMTGQSLDLFPSGPPRDRRG